MQLRKFLFIDRDGTIIEEPDDFQVDSLEKLKLISGVIPALLSLQQAGYSLVMISNQDGLGTDSFPQQDFNLPHDKLIDLLSSQGVVFDAVHVCPHFEHDACDCRKPKLGLVLDYLKSGTMDLQRSYVIGDRDSDVQLADKMGIASFQINSSEDNSWPVIVNQILYSNRCATIKRTTSETDIVVTVNLDQTKPVNISTQIGFFDHMLEQLAKHAGVSLQLMTKGDLHIDEHHTVEDTALALGQALRQALGDKLGIARYGFVLPMDEAQANIAIDLSGRAYLNYDAQLNRESVGGLPTELVPHFFRSFADSLAATLHITVTGDNAHHMIEAMFKGIGRALRIAIKQENDELPTTKGVL